jgi:hypothetical protein
MQPVFMEAAAALAVTVTMVRFKSARSWRDWWRADGILICMILIWIFAGVFLVRLALS